VVISISGLFDLLTYTIQDQAIVQKRLWQSHADISLGHPLANSEIYIISSPYIILNASKNNGFVWSLYIFGTMHGVFHIAGMGMGSL